MGTRAVAEYDPTLPDHALNIIAPLLRGSGGYPQPAARAQIHTHEWFSVAPLQVVQVAHLVDDAMVPFLVQVGAYCTLTF